MIENNESMSRWRELAAVDPNVILLGCDQGNRRALALTLVGDLQDALEEIRRRRIVILENLARDPLTLLNVDSGRRQSNGGQELCSRTQTLLHKHAAGAREVARLDEVAAAILPRLFAADRLVVG